MGVIPRGKYVELAEIYLRDHHHAKVSATIFLFVWRVLEILQDHPEGLARTRVMEYSRHCYTKAKEVFAFMERKQLIMMVSPKTNTSILFMTAKGEELLTYYRGIKRLFR
jgi:predicted transcriptional regulator